MWEKYFLSKRSRYIFGQSYGKLTSKGVGVNKRAQPNIFSSSTCESFHSLAFQQSNATACRENGSKSSFFLTNSEKFVFGEVIPQKVGNCLNKESILVRHGCWHFVLVNRLLTMPAYHYNRKLQPRICRVMDINEVKSGEFSTVQPISSQKYFSENEMDKHDKIIHAKSGRYLRYISANFFGFSAKF